MTFGAAVIPGVVSAQAQTETPTTTQPKPAASRPLNSVVVSLIRQDFSDCVNSDVTKESASSNQLVGYIYVTKSEFDGKLFVEVDLRNGTPNTKYNVFLKCKQKIGEIHTNDSGVGDTVLLAPLNIVPSVFAFDMYPDGAPSGNKYQSTQVKY